MKKSKILTIFLIVFLVMANASYALAAQPQQQGASDGVNLSSSDFKIENIEITKSDGSTVAGNVYGDGENSKTDNPNASASSSLPDLATTLQLVTQGGGNYTGQNINFKATVTNQGTGYAAAPITCRVFEADTNTTIGNIAITSGLNGGDRATITFTLTFNTPAQYTIGFEANPSPHTIAESNFTNNCDYVYLAILPTVRLGVINYDQGYYACWATACAMVISYFKNDQIDRTTDLLKNYGNSINNPNWGDPSSPLGLPIGDFYLMRDYVKNYTSINGSYQMNPLSWAAVQYQTNNGGPIIATIKQLAPAGRHAEVIVGYDIPSQAVIYNNPAGGQTFATPYSYYYGNSNPQWYWETSTFWK